MRSLARTSLGLLGLALIAPQGARAQDAPSYVPYGYQAAQAPEPVAMPAPAPAAEAPHKHKGRSICASCAAKLKAMNSAMTGKVVGCEHYQGGDGDTVCPSCRAKFAKTGMLVGSGMPGRIVGCEHSRNGVCPACQAALNLPGQFVMAGGQPPMMAAGQPGQAPGRAIASSGSPSPSAYDPAMADPSPVGVVQANFSQGGPMGAPAAFAPQQPMAPGRAVAESTAGHEPYQQASTPFPRPRIIRHLLGFTGFGAERAEEKARKKAEVHAMISYDKDANAPVSDLPASMVFGKKAP